MKFLGSGVDESDVVTFQRKADAKLISQRASSHKSASAFIQPFANFERLDSSGEPLSTPLMLTKSSLVAAQADPLHRRRHDHRTSAGHRAVTPGYALVNPGAQQCDLFGRQRIALSRWRHLH